MNLGRFCVFERKIERKVCIQTGFDFVCFRRTYTQDIAYWYIYKLWLSKWPKSRRLEVLPAKIWQTVKEKLSTVVYTVIFGFYERRWIRPLLDSNRNYQITTDASHLWLSDNNALIYRTRCLQTAFFKLSEVRALEPLILLGFWKGAFRFSENLGFMDSWRFFRYTPLPAGNSFQIHGYQ